MTENPSLARLRAAATDPTWVDVAGYALEKVHTNVLARALATQTLAAHRLAAALWHRASGEALAPRDVTGLRVRGEHPLGRGTGSVVDLFVEVRVGDASRQLAVETKTDGAPDGEQLASLAAGLGAGPDRRLVLLTLGAAQACRMEAAHKLKVPVPWWRVADVLALGAEIEAASPSSAVARAWLEELGREELRQSLAFEDEARLSECGYRERLLAAYRYRLAADALAPDGGAWSVAVQPFGVVLTELPSARRVPFGDTAVTLYLEVVDKVLRVKAGAWDTAVDPRVAAAAVVPVVRAALEARGFRVEPARKVAGRSVTLLTLDPHDADWSRDALVPRLRRAYAAWQTIPWPT